MRQVLFLAACVSVLLLSWPPFLHRRFSRDGLGRPLGRAILWSFGVYLLVGLMADLTFRLPHGEIVPLVLLGAPLPVNALHLFAKFVHAKAKN